MAHKLDLSRLTDEEAMHVWVVVQRDLNLRKAEEERLGAMKTQIEKEDTKRELLGSQSNLVDSHCIRCLHPFKFLVNSKRQCLDCQMFTCKSCSRYNRKEHGWVCNNCRMTRVLNISSAGWFHDNVRNRFKRFGSAKVMRLLCKRLSGDGSQDNDTQSMPEVRTSYNGHEDEQEAEAQRYKAMRRGKRLLSVHPLDFDVEECYLHSRRQSVQEERATYRNDMEYQSDMYNHRMNRRRSMDPYGTRPEEYGDNRMVRTRSLSKISSSVSRRQYVDTSDEEDTLRYHPTYQQPYRRRASSQENLPQSPPIIELSERMSAIESLLNRLEEKMKAPGDEEDKATASAAQNEEEKLRRKLSELAGNLNNEGLSSDEEAGKRLSLARGTPAKSSASLPLLRDPEMSSSRGHDMHTEAQKVYKAVGKSFELESKLRLLEENAKSRSGGTTDSELSELEDVVALAAARVRSTKSEVSDIESKIAALSVVGMDRTKKKVSGSQQRKRSNHDFATKTSNGRDRSGNR